MKSVSILLLVFVLPFCSNKNKDVKIREVYEYKEWGASHFIELRKNNDSIIGTYFGSHTTSNGKIIYYRSNFVYSKDQTHSEHDRNREIYFTLTDYSFSLKPLFCNDQNKELIKDSSLIPPALMARQIFRGKFYGEILELQRTLDSYDSRFDVMIFIKEGYDKQ